MDFESSSSSSPPALPLHYEMSSCTDDVDSISSSMDAPNNGSCQQCNVSKCPSDSMKIYRRIRAACGAIHSVAVIMRRYQPIFKLAACLLFCTYMAAAAAWSPPAAVLQSPRGLSIHVFAAIDTCQRLQPLQFSASRQQQQPSRAASKSQAATLDEALVADLTSQLDLLRQILDRDAVDTVQPLQILEDMLQALHSSTSTVNSSHSNAIIVNKAFRELTTYSFSYPYDLEKINLGMNALKLQLNLNSSLLNAVPRGTWLKALRALTSNEINSRPSPSIPSLSTTNSNYNNEEYITPADASFQILQRLITNRGVSSPKKSQHPSLDERDFNMVLHAYATHNRMTSAHRIMALQQRTPHAPPLSPVAYSILLKAYGRLGDVKNVQMSLDMARRNGVKADLVMVNTVLDAYVNCGLVDKAEELFYSLTDVENGRGKGGGGGKDGSTTGGDTTDWPMLQPNVRTCNTMLKGFANEGKVKKALKLSRVMEEKGLWDDVSTNTLVKAAVAAQEFHVAETILANHTVSTFSSSNNHGHKQSSRDHPNIEAYTELIDGYAKDNQLEKALEIMSLMKQRNVPPNEYTYTCIVGALTRNNKVRQAKKMMDYVTSLNFPYSQRGKRVLTPIFNAFISGLLSGEAGGEGEGSYYNNQATTSHSLNLLEALNTLSEMEKLEVYPNVVTVTLLIDGLANCNPPRVKEAKELVQHIEFTIMRSGKQKKGRYGRVSSDGSIRISPSETRIGTALIRAYGRDYDADSAVNAFRRIAKPDVVALNALLDACCKSNKLKIAFEMFEKYTSFEKWRDDESIIDIGPLGDEIRCRAIHPDVVTYTTLITAVLQLKHKNASKRAAKLYSEMKQVWRISPDTVLVDKILYTMTNGGPRGFEENDIQFTLQVLRDGEQLDWEGNQYQKRKRAVRTALMACSSEVWKNDEALYGLDKSQDDPLFLKKGWNKIDSGFRLWGGGNGGEV
ncbi:hypothetical protein ACHAWO_004323, partial [Cyclotella atomus]